MRFSVGARAADCLAGLMCAAGQRANAGRAVRLDSPHGDPRAAGRGPAARGTRRGTPGAPGGPAGERLPAEECRRGARHRPVGGLTAYVVPPRLARWRGADPVPYPLPRAPVRRMALAGHADGPGTRGIPGRCRFQPPRQPPRFRPVTGARDNDLDERQRPPGTRTRRARSITTLRRVLHPAPGTAGQDTDLGAVPQPASGPPKPPCPAARTSLLSAASPRL